MLEVRDRFKKAFTKSRLSTEDVADLVGVRRSLVENWINGTVPNWINAVALVRFIYTVEQCEAEDGLPYGPTAPRWFKVWWIESAHKADQHELLKGWSRLAKMMSDMGVTAAQAAPWLGVSSNTMTSLVLNRVVSRLYYDPLLRFALALKVVHDAGGFVGGTMNEAEFRPVWDRVQKLDLPSRQLANEQRKSNTLAAGTKNS